MKKIIADLHTHTLASGHAYGTIREMAAAAAEQGLEILGITEHAPGIPGTVDPFYYCNLKAVPRVLSGVNLLHGSEINVLSGGKLSLEDKFLSRLDYGIAGIHCQCYEDEGREANTRNLIECIRHPRVRFVSHPDDDHTPLDYHQLVPAAKEYAVALEVNNSSFVKGDMKRLNCTSNIKTMLGLCMDLGVNIIVSSDAHDPSAVGDFGLAMKFLSDFGFNEALILNNDKDKILDFIGFGRV